MGSVGCSTRLGFPPRTRCPHEVRHGASKVAEAGDDRWEVGSGLGLRPGARASPHAALRLGLTAPGSEGSSGSASSELPELPPLPLQHRADWLRRRPSLSTRLLIGHARASWRAGARGVSGVRR